LQAGDHITTIDGAPVQFWVQMSNRIEASEGRPIQVRWVRPDSLSTPGTASLTPVAVTTGGKVYESEITPMDDNGRPYIGVLPGVRYEEYGLGESIVGGITDTWLNTKLTAISLKRIFTGRENIRENLGGPVMVAKITGQAAQAGGRAFWSIVAMLSITLAIVNIMPIPALDGGHLVFLIYEGITRREPSLKVRMVMQQVGMVLLLCLMAFLVFNDLLRL
jgi:regulator of sigma E protease